MAHKAYSIYCLVLSGNILLTLGLFGCTSQGMLLYIELIKCFRERTQQTLEETGKLGIRTTYQETCVQ